ncbi:hypothetical protein BGZ60DRAFT_529989 [Tricladium varicosporioides]|nr:hypothetical protein BGZ60DRAFT_529989 [Hymenoscyphus varicosporioides]
MYFNNLLPVVALLSVHISSSLALPTTIAEEPHQIEARAAGSVADPHLLNIDCNGVEEVCEAQCLAIHCFNSPAIMQYNSGVKKANFIASGAKALFSSGKVRMDKKGVAIPPGHPTYTSAEETSNESATEGGKGCLLVPVSVAHNLAEGKQYQTQLQANKVAQMQYFKKKYTGLSTNTPYCNAYMKNVNDKAVCTGSKSRDDPMNFIYRKTSKKNGNAYVFHKMKYPTDKWTKNGL